jgi:uncharacterized protein
MLTKSCNVAVKAAGPDDGADEGVFEALVSVFGNVDSYGDVVMPGAFAASLDEWAKSGAPIPVYWSHRMDDPDYNIGEVLEAKETADGLWVKGRLDLDSPKAAQVYRLFKGRRVTQFSFAYDVREGAWVEKDGAEFYELRDVKLYEVGPTPIGANQETDLLAVKSAARHLAAKAGRVLSSKNENTLREAADQLDGALAAVKSVLAALPSDEGDGKATASTSGKAEDPSGGKAEDRTPSATVDLSELDALDLALAVG